MRVLNCEFVKSVASARELIQDSRPQIAFVGRSNVGKSSLLNMLTGRKKIARVSTTPGRTRLVNYFLVNGSLYFVDLPGYGFAQGNQQQNMWSQLIESYLLHNDQLKCVCLLLDVRHKPSDDDQSMLEFLVYHAIPFVPVVTKCDKLNKSQLNEQLKLLATELKVGVDDLVATSNETRMGQTQLLEKLAQKIAVPHQE